MSKNYKFLVIYVFSEYDEISRLKNFVKSYDNNYSGYPHELLICYKLINKKKLSLCRNILSNIKHKEFIDPININDFEFKTMERAIQSYNNYLILFLISHCCFEKKNWLKIINDSYEENSFVGFSGSNESMFTSLKFKKLWKFISFLKNYFYFKKNFAKYPNPHVRLPSFVLKQKDFLEFVKNKNYLTKKDAWRSEAGISGMTNFFLNKKFKVYIINSEAEKFTLFNMFQSFTFCNQDISKIIISDRHTRNYFLLSNDKKNDMKKRVWGS